MVMREQGIEMWIIRDDEADLYYNNHKLHYNTLYAFEPHTRVAVPGWEHGLELGSGRLRPLPRMDYITCTGNRRPIGM